MLTPGTGFIMKVTNLLMPFRTLFQLFLCAELNWLHMQHKIRDKICSNISVIRIEIKGNELVWHTQTKKTTHKELLPQIYLEP